jgi:hypothetical protein
MTDAGLTHGTFYSHFASKEELETAAFAQAVTTGRPKWTPCRPRCARTTEPSAAVARRSTHPLVSPRQPATSNSQTPASEPTAPPLKTKSTYRVLSRARTVSSNCSTRIWLAVWQQLQPYTSRLVPTASATSDQLPNSPRTVPRTTTSIRDGCSTC